MNKPTYLTIKKVMEVEEFYHIRENLGKALDKGLLEAGLTNGQLNIIPVPACESILWVVNQYGKRIAVLEKDGGCSSEETIKIEANCDIRRKNI